MRILLIRNYKSLELTEYSHILYTGLRSLDINIDFHDVSNWIPSHTGKSIDKIVTKKLKKLAQSYNLIHALDFRSAWACGEAFSTKTPWLYSAHHFPKTLHPELIGRIEKARIGICSLQSIYDVLQNASFGRLKLVYPGIKASHAVTPFSERKPHIILNCELNSNDSEIRLSKILNQLWSRLPYLEIKLFSHKGLTPETFESLLKPNQISIISFKEQFKYLPYALLYIDACEAWKFNYSLLHALSFGTPLLLKRNGGFDHLIEENLSGFFFDDDYSLGNEIANLIISRKLLSQAYVESQKRFEKEFTLKKHLTRVHEIYQTLLK